MVKRLEKLVHMPRPQDIFDLKVEDSNRLRDSITSLFMKDGVPEPVDHFEYDREKDLWVLRDEGLRFEGFVIYGNLGFKIQFDSNGIVVNGETLNIISNVKFAFLENIGRSDIKGLYLSREGFRPWVFRRENAYVVQ